MVEPLIEIRHTSLYQFLIFGFINKNYKYFSQQMKNRSSKERRNPTRESQKKFKTKHNDSTAQSFKPSLGTITNMSFEFLKNSRPVTPIDIYTFKDYSEVKKANKKKQARSVSKKKQPSKKTNKENSKPMSKSVNPRSRQAKSRKAQNKWLATIKETHLKNLQELPEELLSVTSRNEKKQIFIENEILNQKLMASEKRLSALQEENKRQISELVESHSKQKEQKTREMSTIQRRLREEISMKENLKKKVSQYQNSINHLQINLKGKEEDISKKTIDFEDYERKKNAYIKDLYESGQKINWLKQKILFANSDARNLNQRVQARKLEKQFIQKNTADVLSFIRSHKRSESDGLETRKGQFD